MSKTRGRLRAAQPHHPHAHVLPLEGEIQPPERIEQRFDRRRRRIQHRLQQVPRPPHRQRIAQPFQHRQRKQLAIAAPRHAAPHIRHQQLAPEELIAMLSRHIQGIRIERPRNLLPHRADSIPSIDEPQVELRILQHRLHRQQHRHPLRASAPLRRFHHRRSTRSSNRSRPTRKPESPGPAPPPPGRSPRPARSHSSPKLDDWRGGKGAEIRNRIQDLPLEGRVHAPRPVDHPAMQEPARIHIGPRQPLATHRTRVGLPEVQVRHRTWHRYQRRYAPDRRPAERPDRCCTNRHRNAAAANRCCWPNSARAAIRSARASSSPAVGTQRRQIISAINRIRRNPRTTPTPSTSSRTRRHQPAADCHPDEGRISSPQRVSPDDPAPMHGPTWPRSALELPHPGTPCFVPSSVELRENALQSPGRSCGPPCPPVLAQGRCTLRYPRHPNLSF